MHHAELWGQRQDKYAWLLDNGLETTPWQELAPQAPFYLFVPQNTDALGGVSAGLEGDGYLSGELRSGIVTPVEMISC